MAAFDGTKKYQRWQCLLLSAIFFSSKAEIIMSRQIIMYNEMNYVTPVQDITSHISKQPNLHPLNEKIIFHHSSLFGRRLDVILFKHNMFQNYHACSCYVAKYIRIKNYLLFHLRFYKNQETNFVGQDIFVYQIIVNYISLVYCREFPNGSYRHYNI